MRNTALIVFWGYYPDLAGYRRRCLFKHPDSLSINAIVVRQQHALDYKIGQTAPVPLHC